MRFLAARRLGCSHDTIARYIQRYPQVRTVAEAARGVLVDTAELKLWEATERGEQWAVVLVLKTLGKDRGYTERQEVQIPDREHRNGHRGISERTAEEIRRKILGLPGY